MEKNGPPVSPATLLYANPQYAHVRLPSGVEITVCLRDIAQHRWNKKAHDES